MKSIKVLGSIRLEEDMEWRPSASYGRWPLISTEFLNYSAVQTVPITDLHIVILAHVVKFQAQHVKSWRTRTHSQAAYSAPWLWHLVMLVPLLPQWINKSLTTWSPSCFSSIFASWSLEANSTLHSCSTRILQWQKSEVSIEVIQSAHVHQVPNHITMLELSSRVTHCREHISIMAVC